MADFVDHHYVQGQKKLRRSRSRHLESLWWSSLRKISEQRINRPASSLQVQSAGNSCIQLPQLLPLTVSKTDKRKSVFWGLSISSIPGKTTSKSRGRISMNHTSIPEWLRKLSLIALKEMNSLAMSSLKVLSTMPSTSSKLYPIYPLSPVLRSRIR